MHIVRMNGTPSTPTEAAQQLHVHEFGPFRFFDHAFDGTTYCVVDESKCIAYCQVSESYDGLCIWQIESHENGCGRLLLEYFQERFDRIVAVGVEYDALGFWDKMDFVPEREVANPENIVNYVWTSQW